MFKEALGIEIDVEGSVGAFVLKDVRPVVGKDTVKEGSVVDRRLRLKEVEGRLVDMDNEVEGRVIVKDGSPLMFGVIVVVIVQLPV